MSIAIEKMCPECGTIEPMFSAKRQCYICEECSHEWAKEELPVTPLRIFLSYGHDDNEELVRKIKSDLEARGHDVWFDKSGVKESGIVPGDDWRRKITDGITNSHKVLSFLSKHSTRDPGVCLDEIGIAIGAKGGNIQTILVEGESEVHPPPSISHLQWLDMHEWKQHQGAGQDLWDAWYNEKFDEIVRVVESAESIRFAGEIEELSTSLKPVKSDGKMSELLKKPFVGREWMRQAVEDWRKSRENGSRLFWIMGNPGVGKSAFVANLAHFGRDKVIALHFCEWNKQDHKNPRQVVLNIAFQLACRLPDYRKQLLILPEIKELGGKDAAELFSYLLVEPLKCVIDGGRQRYLVIIDALDEANENGRNPLAELLAYHAQRLPEWLGLLITSRPEEEVKTPLQGLAELKPFILATEREENLEDIRDFLRHQLPDAIESTINTIVKKSDGVFLYAEYICEEMRLKHLSLDDLNAFPQGLGGIYAQYFARQFPNLEEYKNITRHALGVLAAAREPIEPAFLAQILDWDEYQLDDFLSSMGSLLKHSEETLHPFHKSLFDWLTDKAKVGVYFVSRLEGENTLTDQGTKEAERGYEKLPLYFIRHLPSHLMASGRWDALIGNDKKPGPLTDLSFIEAKCAAGLAHDLVRDYNAALAALPEFREENKRLAKHDDAMFVYNKALREYAVVRYDWFLAKQRGESVVEPPYPPLPVELQARTETYIPEDHSERAARLRHFSNFVNAHIDPLVATPHNTLPMAVNFAKDGPVVADAERDIASKKEPWLRRSPRPPAPPLRPQCLRSLDGHIKRSRVICMCPDGQRAISGSWDKTLRVWDLETGACLNILEGHTNFIEDLSVSSDGRCAISTSLDETLVWNLETGKCLRILHGKTFENFGYSHNENVSPDGRRVISNVCNKQLIIRNRKTGECLQTLDGHADAVSSVSVSPDGRRAISGSEDMTLRVWDLETGQCLRTLKGHTSRINSVSVSPDGRCAVSGSDDKTLRVWNLETGKCLRILHGHSSTVVAVRMCLNGRRVISGSLEGTLRVWDLEANDCPHTLNNSSKWGRSLCFSTDDQRAISVNSDNNLCVWDMETNECLQVLDGHTNRVNSVSMSSDGRRAISASSDMTLRVWDLATGECLRTLEDQNYKIDYICISTDGHRAITNNLNNHSYCFWNIETGKKLCTFDEHTARGCLISWNIEIRRAFSENDDRTIQYWDLDTGVCLCALTGHTDKISSVILSPDGRSAVSSSYDKTLRIWNLETSECWRTLEGHTGKVYFVSMSPDGRYVISASNDATLRVWDFKTGECLLTLNGHKRWFSKAIVSPDGRCVVSANNDKTLRVWDLKAGECLAVCYRDSSSFTMLKFVSPSRISSSTADGQMHFLTPVNFPLSGPSILTATNPQQARCPCCAAEFEPPPEVVAAIHQLTATLRPDQSPCLELPDAAFDDQRLLADCPHCGEALKFNPFFGACENNASTKERKAGHP